MNFIFTLIDPGCFVTIEQRDVVVSEGFYAHVDDFKFSEDYRLFQENKRAPTHIFIDLREQYYALETLPSMSLWKERKILRLKCQSENSRLQSIHFRKESDHTYLFTDLTLSENHLEWIEFLSKSDHPLKSPRLVPIEIETLLHDQSLVPFPEKPCLIVMYYEELIGLRQLVFMNKKIVAARLATITEKNIKNQIALETDDLVSYLMVERSIDPGTIGLLLLGNTSLFSKLPPIPQAVIDWSRFQKTSLKKGLPFNVWSMMSLSVLKEKPSLHLKLPCLEPYRLNERRRTVFALGSFFCLWMLCLGGFIVQSYQKTLIKKIDHLKELINSSSSNKPIDVLAMSSKEQSIAYGYEHLKTAAPHPFFLLDEAQEWLQDHWEVNHIEWAYHSPKFQRESWVLDPLPHTQETLDLWVDYLGSDSKQQHAREVQISRPLKTYKIMKNVHVKETEVIRIIKEGIDL